MTHYKQAEIEIISVNRTASTRIEIKYRPMLETLHYSPGANANSQDGRLKLQFVRCGIKDKCAVEHPGKNIGVQIWQISLPDSAQPIDVLFADGEKNIYP